MRIFSTRTCRRSAALVGGATLALSGIAALPLVASGAAAAAPVIDGTSVYGALTHVTSTTRHKLQVSMSASRYSSGGTSVGVRLATPSGNESHGWSFKAPDSALAISSKGSGTITMAATKLGGFGQLKLHVKPVSKVKTTSCGGQVISKTRRVAINGVMRFVTKSTGGKKWGSVGSRSFHFAAGSSVYWSYQHTATCPSTPLPCISGSRWSTYAPGSKVSTSISGGASGKSTYLYGFRNVALPKPAGAYRYDSVNVSTKAARFSVAPNGTAHLRATLGRGSATLVGKNSSTNETPCGTGSKTSKSTYWYGTSYKNGPTPLKLPAQIFGVIKVGDSKDGGSISRTTVS